ncbi:hypothetical protein [Chryseobacterium gambrini]|uniref:Conjugal transfer protein TraD n=1 Tax=Chryseobacterium gambrini TaxID=373672 RepID=A0A1N7PYM4_9FLAO|nr:hypothetical protein [Chryseobacterium gambrini]SIT15728.1 hypothetical protein SAMN05421785_10840 [Chryseobacterium gambrini]
MEAVIQIVILFCLFTIIVLLAIDKVKIVKSVETPEPKAVSSQLPDVMGKTHKDADHSLREERISGRPLIKPKNNEFDQPNKVLENPLKPQLESELPIDTIEDEEWLEDEFPPYDERFSQGVSLEELLTVGKLLQQNDLGSEQQNKVIDVMQKIQGTDLYNVLENTIEGASQRVAILLDKTLDSKNLNDLAPSEGNLDDFDIGNFL